MELIMNESQIQEEVLRYLDDSNYQYALLIDGEWGCGKTYFMLHALSKAIENHEKNSAGRTIKYISVYGCKTVEEIEEKIYWSIIDKKFFEIKDKMEKGLLDEAYGDKKAKRNKASGAILATSKKLISSAMQKFGINYKAFEYIEDFFSLEHYILVFDDLERCNCPINDLLGYINGLVEHDEVKVILIANEKEIGRLSRSENRELQYLVASNENIEISEPENGIWPKHNLKDTPKKKLTPEELDRRRKELFTENDVEQQYQKIKEKLIGVTVLYQPDFDKVIHQLIEKSNSTRDLKKLLHQNARFFVGKMNECNHRNFRTFQFFLSKVEYLYEKLNKSSIECQYLQPLVEFILQNCFTICVEYKGNIPEPENQLLKIMRQQRKEFQSIRDYVCLSRFDVQKFETEVISYIQDELINKVPSDDPYSELYYNYYLRSQKWCEEKIDQIIEKLSHNKYPVNIYKNILSLFISLRNLGFSNQIVTKASETMFINAKRGNITKKIVIDLIHLENEKDKREFEQIINKFNAEVIKNKIDMKAASIQRALKDETNWARLIQEYIKTKIQETDSDSGILDKAPIEMWIERISTSEPENIDIFRNVLGQFYPKNVIRKSSYADMPYMKEIIAQLEKYIEKVDDVIQKAQLSWLINDMKKIYYHQTEELAQFYAKE